MQSDIFNAETFKLFLQKIIAEADVGTNTKNNKKKILLVLDNAKYHHAKLLQGWLKEMENVIELFFIPHYSPDLNPIEMLWKKTRREVTHNRFFETLDKLSYDLRMYWNQFLKPNQKLNFL